MNTFALRASELNAPKIVLPLADHNTPLPGDILGTVALNYQWRRIMVHLAEKMLDRRIFVGTVSEIDTAMQQVHALLSDMYTFEATGMTYHGALVTKNTVMTLTTSFQVIREFTVSGNDSHDTDGFFDPTFDTGFFQIPVGLGGFYLVRGVYHVNAGANVVWFSIRKGVFERVTAESGHTGLDIINVQQIMRLNDGDNVSVVGQVGVGTRQLFINVVWDKSAQFSIVRLGDAP